MLRETRHEKLLHILGQEDVLSLGEIARRLGVSEATARRDVTDLSDAGRLRKVYGGAIGLPRTKEAERPFNEEEVGDLPAKDAVAASAALLVQDGETILLDIGTTTLRMARLLHGRPITVVTSNLAVYEELRTDTAVSLVLLGGRVRRNYQSLVGNLTHAALREVYVDRAFLGTSGILSDGRVLDTTEVEVPGKRAMLKASRQAVLLATARKFPGTGNARVCQAGDIDVLITNQASDPATLATFREANVKVVQA